MNNSIDKVIPASTLTTPPANEPLNKIGKPNVNRRSTQNSYSKTRAPKSFRRVRQSPLPIAIAKIRLSIALAIILLGEIPDS